MEKDEIEELHNKITKENKNNSIINYKIYNNMFITNSKLSSVVNLVDKNAFCKDDVTTLNEIFENKILEISKNIDINKSVIDKYKSSLNGKQSKFLAGSNWSKENYSKDKNIAGIIVNQLDMLSKIINLKNRKVYTTKIKEIKSKYAGDKIKTEIEKEKQIIISRIKLSLKKSQNNSGISLNEEVLKNYMKTISFKEKISYEHKEIYKQFLSYVLTYKWLKSEWKFKIEFGYDQESIKESYIENKYKQIQEWVEKNEN